MTTGTRRNLLKALEDLFTGKVTEGKNNEESLDRSIENYLLEHNKFIRNKNSRLSHELYTIYKQHVSGDRDKEMLFVGILQKLISCIVDNGDFMNWIEKYSNLTVDSAGLDLEYVEVTRALIQSVLDDLEGPFDSQMIELKQIHSDMVLKALIERYLQQVDGATTSKAAVPIYELEEKNRFTKLNCKKLIEHFVSRHPNRYMKVFNEQYVLCQQKQNMLTLFSSIMESLNLENLQETSLINTLLDDSLTEESAQTLTSLLSVLCRLFPRLYQHTPARIPILYAVHARLACWNYGVTKFNQNDYENVILNHELQRLFISFFRITILLYALYPLCFCKYIGSAKEFLEKNNLLSRVPNFEEDRFENLSRSVIGELKVHPNFTRFISAEEEIAHPPYLDSLETVEDIAMFCRQLHESTLFSDSLSSAGEKTESPDTIRPDFDSMLEVQSKLYTKTLAETGDEKVDQSKSTQLLDESLQFYRRELMICSNEFDFLNYIKNVCVTKLKESRQKNAVLSSKLGELEALKRRNRILTEEIEKVQTVTEKSSRNGSVDQGILIEANRDLKSENTRIREQLRLLSDENEKLRQKLEVLTLELEPLHVELSAVKNMNTAISNDYKTLAAKSTKSQNITSDSVEQHTKTSVSNLESENLFLKQELKRITASAKSEQLAREVDLREKLDSLIKENRDLKERQKNNNNNVIIHLMALHDDKVAMLNEKIQRLESELRQKETRVTGWGSAQPINIPSSNRNQERRETNKPLLGSELSFANSVKDDPIVMPKLWPMQGSEGPPTPLETDSPSVFVPKRPAVEPQTGKGPTKVEHGDKLSFGGNGGFSFSIRKHSAPTIDNSNIVVRGRGGLQNTKSKLKM